MDFCTSPATSAEAASMRTLVVRNWSVFGAESITESGPFSRSRVINGPVSEIRAACIPQTLRTRGDNESDNIIKKIKNKNSASGLESGVGNKKHFFILPALAVSLSS